MVINVYPSNPADQWLAGFALALSHNLCRPVQQLPLTRLPQPDPLRRQALRVERLELLEEIAQTQHDLDCFHYGEWAPNAGRENGLRFHLEALNCRLRGVEAILGLGRGGTDNA